MMEIVCRLVNGNPTRPKPCAVEGLKKSEAIENYGKENRR